MTPAVFAFWRQSMDRSQSIFALHNVSRTPQTIPAGALNLIPTEPWRDLVGGQPFHDLAGAIELQPYQSVWLTNR